MAIKWYLMQEPPYYGEDDDMAGMFQEACNSMVGHDVTVWNYDLSEGRELRATLINRTQDTLLNAMTRAFLFEPNTVKAGMYIEYEDRYWLVENIVDNNGVFDKAIGRICNVRLMWLNEKGLPVVRWANAANATQYNNGETNAKYYYIRSDQLIIKTPDDDESLLIKTGMRMVIDKRIKMYEKTIPENVECDTSFPLLTYEVTRADNVEYDYVDSGIVQYIFTQDEQHEHDGYYKIGGKPYWLCEVPQITIDEESKCEILYDENIIYIGADETVFMAQFDQSKNADDIQFEWEITCDFKEDLQIETDGLCVMISTESKKLRNKSFTLRLIADGYESAEIEVLIKAFY